MAMMLATGLMLLAGMGKHRLELRPPSGSDGDVAASALHGGRHRDAASATPSMMGRWAARTIGCLA